VAKNNRADHLISVEVALEPNTPKEFDSAQKLVENKNKKRVSVIKPKKIKGN